MSLSQAKKYIDASLAINSINSLGISGGEPLLYLEDICEISKHAYSKGFREISVSTNGFWASSIDEARKILFELRSSGIIKLQLSTDDFHQEFVPIENIKNILRASEEVDIAINTVVMVSAGSKRLADVLLELGDTAPYSLFAEYKVLPIGEAKRNSVPVIRKKLIINEFSKCGMLNSLAVFPNGDTYPCCSQFCQNEILKIGNMGIDEAEKIQKQFNSNMVIRILKKYGFKWFLDRNPKLDNEYVFLCDLCNAILQDEQGFYKEFGEHIEQEKQKIYQAYLGSKDLV